MRIAAASGAGDVDTAAKSFEAHQRVAGKSCAADKLRMIESIAGGYYRAKDYAKADAVGPALFQGRRHAARTIRNAADPERST